MRNLQNRLSFYLNISDISTFFSTFSVFRLETISDYLILVYYDVTISTTLLVFRMKWYVI